MGEIPRNLPKRLIEALASVKLSFVLLLALAVASILGTLIPQNQPPAAYFQAYGPGGARIILALGLNDMYHSWWFTSLVGLLGLNLVVCSLKRLPRALELMRVDPQAELDRPRGTVEAQVEVEGKLEDVLRRVREVMGRRVGKVHERIEGAKAVVFAHRGGWSRMGVYGVHLSVLIIMAGAVVGNLLGFNGEMRIFEGSKNAVVELDGGGHKRLGFEVELKKFTVTYYPDGTPSEYRSDVVFWEHGRAVRSASIRVNHPVSHRGIYFYQSTYGHQPRSLRLLYRSASGTRELTLTPGKWVELERGVKARIMAVRPRVRMGIYDGPVARIILKNPSGQMQAVVAFKAGSTLDKRLKGPLAIVSLTTATYSGLQVKHDPGVWLVWVGCGLLVAGLVVAFYFSHRKVWAVVQQQGEKVRVRVMGVANKDKAGFKLAVERIAEEIGGGNGGA